MNIDIARFWITRQPDLANLFSAKLIVATLIEVVEKSAPAAVKYISCEKCAKGYRVPLSELAV